MNVAVSAFGSEAFLFLRVGSQEEQYELGQRYELFINDYQNTVHNGLFLVSFPITNVWRVLLVS